MDSIIVRPLQKIDTKSILKLYSKADVTMARRYVDIVTNIPDDEQKTLYGIIVCGMLVGTATIGPNNGGYSIDENDSEIIRNHMNNTDEKEFMVLSEVYIDKKYRGNGLSVTLIDAIIETNNARKVFIIHPINSGIAKHYLLSRYIFESSFKTAILYGVKDIKNNKK